ncbi:hypothetical protein Tco_0750039 [Tanacetum coccineum]|uniref:Uncharacterized protein n=1 Tax=Tanacetum coccineum TaxID=301880 RepID=A0ABQ4Z3T2_9ASTR
MAHSLVCLEERNSNNQQTQCALLIVKAVTRIADANSQCDHVEGVQKNTYTIDKLPKKYNFLSQSVIPRNTRSGKDFKNLHPNDYEDLFPYTIFKKSSTICLRQQTRLIHGSQHVDKKPGIQDSYWKTVSSEAKRRWLSETENDAKKCWMRLNDLHKFMMGTFTRVHGKRLDHMFNKIVHQFE